jgi:hypothetical protein
LFAPPAYVQTLARAAAHDDEILEHDAGGRERDGERLRIAPEVFAEIDAAVASERRHRQATPGVQRI